LGVGWGAGTTFSFSCPTPTAYSAHLPASTGSRRSTVTYTHKKPEISYAGGRGRLPGHPMR